MAVHVVQRSTNGWPFGIAPGKGDVPSPNSMAIVGSMPVARLARCAIAPRCSCRRLIADVRLAVEVGVLERQKLLVEAGID